MSVEGSLDLFKLPEILQIVAQQRKTGILTVQGGDDIVAVSFLSGAVVGVDSLNRPGEEALAEVLEREGFLDGEKAAAVRVEAHSRGVQLQELVVEEGLLTRYELLAALRIQYQDLLHQLLEWTEGDFKFYVNDEVSFEEGLEPIEVQHLLLSSSLGDSFDEMEGGEEDLEARVALLDEREAPPPPPDVDLTQVYERLPSARPIKVRSPMGHESGDDEGFLLLSPTEQQLLSRIDGQRRLSDLTVDCAMDWRTVVETVDSLKAMALVRRRERVAEGDLQEEVFEPPSLEEFPLFPSEEELAPPPKRRPAVEMDQVYTWGGFGLAVAGLIVLLLTLHSAEALLFPAPWQENQRETYEAVRREALYAKIDRAAKTFFLLQGHFPERLKGLVTGHQLAEADLKDPRGRPLRYEPEDLSYRLAPVAQGEPIEELGSDEAITGNFLLDFDFFSHQGGAADQPLVLLD
ncbi:MAG: DUF4388 domain-containing protein [Acidobacteria bacterium]|nr:DUF4388 domain-containing protein [Acidobacteriota bacterium]